MMEFTYDGIVRQGFGFYNPNHAAALICAVLPFVMAGFFRWRAWTVKLAFVLLFSGMLTALALTFSRTGVIVAALEIVAFFILSGVKDRKIPAAALAIFLITLLLAGVLTRFSIDKAVCNRPLIWLAGLQLCASNPLGVGLGHSGTLASTFLLRDISCRTLINSHLTFLAEFGIIAGLFWFGFIACALISGVRKTSAWIAFAGLTLSAFTASVFDWDLLAGFDGFGGLPLSNYLLSWIVLIGYVALGVTLCAGKFNWKKLAASTGVAASIVVLPFAFYSSDAPHVRNGMIVKVAANMSLVLYDDAWTLGRVLPFLKDGYFLPLKSWQYEAEAPSVDVGTVILFGQCADFAGKYPDACLILVSPPEFFELPGNTSEVYLKRFSEARPEDIEFKFY